MNLTTEHHMMLRVLHDNHLSMRLRACKVRTELKEAGYIASGRSGNWRADRRHTYWHLTAEGHAALSMSSHHQQSTHHQQEK